MGIAAKGFFISLEGEILQEIYGQKAHYSSVEETIDEEAGSWELAKECLERSDKGEGILLWDSDISSVYLHYKGETAHFSVEIHSAEEAAEIVSSIMPQEWIVVEEELDSLFLRVGETEIQLM